MHKTDKDAYTDPTHLYSPWNKLYWHLWKYSNGGASCYPAVEVENAGYSDKFSGVRRKVRALFYARPRLPISAAAFVFM